MAQTDRPDTNTDTWHPRGAAGVTASSPTKRTHGLTMADVERLDRVRQKVMRGRRFQIDSAELLHDARREAGRE